MTATQPKIQSFADVPLHTGDAGASPTHEQVGAQVSAAAAAHGYTAADAPVYNPTADDRHYRRLFTLLGETIG